MAGSIGTKRLSMNTHLKNARIFDDDSWDAETAGFVNCTSGNIESKDCTNVVKSEEKEDGELDDSINMIGESSSTSTQIKEEKYSTNEQTRHFQSIHVKSEYKTCIKSEPIESSSTSKQIKEEKYSTTEQPRYFQNIHVKSEPIDRKFEEGELNDSLNIKKEPEENCTRKTEAILSTPIKKEYCQDESNPSPFNKELFKNFSLDSPQSKEHIKVVKEEKKAVKRVFAEHIKEEKASDEDEAECPSPPIISNFNMKSNVKEEVRVPIKKRLGDKQDHNLPQKRRRKEMETDPLTLSRRQKQIDYGKNTLGYDNYIKKVPRSERSSDDPKTPNKYIQYSRRAWDGLIKQWRLQLHKYDPVDD